MTGKQRQCDQCVEQTINHRGLPNCRSCPTGIGVPVLLRMHDPLLAAVDAWIAAQDVPISRPEGARRLIEMGLESAKKGGKAR